MDIKLEQFKELLEKGLSLDLIYILQKIDEGVEIQGVRLANLVITLERKGYILGGFITVDGKELLTSIANKKIKTKKFPKRDEEFEKWWKIYPGTTEFIWKGRRFAGSRALKVKKEDCRSKFEKVLDEGVLGEDMVKALECEITQKKEESIRRNENKLTYMQNTLTYLNQRTFEPYIELLKDNIVNTVITNSIDI